MTSVNIVPEKSKSKLDELVDEIDQDPAFQRVVEKKPATPPNSSDTRVPDIQSSVFAEKAKKIIRSMSVLKTMTSLGGEIYFEKFTSKGVTGFSLATNALLVLMLKGMGEIVVSERLWHQLVSIQPRQHPEYPLMCVGISENYISAVDNAVLAIARAYLGMPGAEKILQGIDELIGFETFGDALLVNDGVKDGVRVNTKLSLSSALVGMAYAVVGNTERAWQLQKGLEKHIGYGEGCYALWLLEQQGERRMKSINATLVKGMLDVELGVSEGGKHAEQVHMLHEWDVGDGNILLREHEGIDEAYALTNVLAAAVYTALAEHEK